MIKKTTIDDGPALFRYTLILHLTLYISSAMLGIKIRIGLPKRAWRVLYNLELLKIWNSCSPFNRTINAYRYSVCIE